MNIKLIGAAVFGCIGLAACQPDANTNSATGPARLDSGITSSNGGGQRALGGAPNVGIGSNGAVSSTPNGTNTKGNAY